MLCFIVLLVLGIRCSANFHVPSFIIPHPSPVLIVEKQITSLETAVSSGDKKTLLKIFDVTKGSLEVEKSH